MLANKYLTMKMSFISNVSNKTYNFKLASWWRKWCDFVNIECKSYIEHFRNLNNTTHCKISKINDIESDTSFNDLDNYVSVFKSQVSEYIVTPKTDSQKSPQNKNNNESNYYTKPGPII